jgi:hypothetical protein
MTSFSQVTQFLLNLDSDSPSTKPVATSKSHLKEITFGHLAVGLNLPFRIKVTQSWGFMLEDLLLQGQMLLPGGDKILFQDFKVSLKSLQDP